MKQFFYPPTSNIFIVLILIFFFRTATFLLHPWKEIISKRIHRLPGTGIRHPYQQDTSGTQPITIPERPIWELQQPKPKRVWPQASVIHVLYGPTMPAGTPGRTPSLHRHYHADHLLQSAMWQEVLLLFPKRSLMERNKSYPKHSMDNIHNRKFRLDSKRSPPMPEIISSLDRGCDRASI